jgi:glycosyltransferase involved in cell wall biosynthesis
LQKLPIVKNHHEYLSLLTPHAFSKFDFSGFDVVLSVTSAEAKFTKLHKKTLHICYCLTPTRYLWSQKNHYESLGFKGKLLKLTGPISRANDFEASQRVDHFIAISTYIKKQIKKYYKRDSQIIFPPVSLGVEAQDFTPLQINTPFYLIVSRLVSYKRIDLAIKACNQLDRNLVIIGSGQQESKLKKMAGKKVKFVRDLTDEQLASYYMQCRGLIFPGVEDFGIVPVEAQSFGKPVIAYGKGGVLDTIIDGKTSLLFSDQSTKSLKEAILKFEKINFSENACKKQAQNFSQEKFLKNIKQKVEELWQKHNQTFL